MRKAISQTCKMTEVLNFNIGILGHVDSGKTSLAKALSTVASTAAFDKNPQSKERGITLDLGFSSFSVPIPDNLKLSKYRNLQYTLVDCPGHASLIRTIIGGAQIIDLMVLVVDIIKGMQTQTAECLVIGEIVCEKMLVVLNKIDLIPKEKRKAAIEKMTKRMHKTLENTKFSGCTITTAAANPCGSGEGENVKPEGIENLIKLLQEHTYVPSRSAEGPFIFSVDHCFSIRGQGTVMTGTTLSGQVCINDMVEISSLQTTKKVKSIQMFHKPIQSIKQGDRAGICVTQFDPKLLERGLICTPGALPTLYAAVVDIKKIAYYNGAVSTKAKFHITIGHATVMGKISIFGHSRPLCDESIADKKSLSGATEHLDVNKNKTFDFNQDYEYCEELLKDSTKQQWALLEFEKPILCRGNSLAIGSRFDSDIHANKCRLAFKAQIVHPITDKDYAKNFLPNLKVFKNKSREGTVERVHDEYSVICKGLLKKETNIELFAGLHVALSSGEKGVIDGSFGLSGKVKIRIPDGLKSDTKSALPGKGKRGRKKLDGNELASKADAHPITVTMQFKRYVYDPSKKMKQS
ncbi:selenocysteine-specific elongation factor-like isoform X1 [Clavelina lepadiformis]|uniref:selenocysteine-specific elongation factor-like isoform X1 n=1 Tax=Clavelina lepadiformis TaxID=159417 RepID=UPI0040414A16